VALPLSPPQAAAAAAGDLQLRDGTNTVQLVEAPVRAIPVTPMVYIDYRDTAHLSFQVYERGVPAAGARALTLYQMSADGGTITSQTTVETDARGLYAFSVPGASGGPPPPGQDTPGRVVAYVAAADPSQAPDPQQGLNPLVCTYVYLRVLAADEQIAALPPTWDNVYKHVLANWNAMAPCMDNWLMLDDPAQVRAYAPIIKRLTDPGYFEGFRYMPITRDLTAGCRALLYKFLAAREVTADAAALRAPAAAPSGVPFAQLSRSLRRP
jgi:hypothetical protein